MRLSKLGPMLAIALLPVIAVAAPVTQGRFIKYVQTIADMERSYAFYKALGLEAEGPAAIDRKPAANAMVVRLTGSTEGMVFRNAYLKVPGTAFQFEFTEFGQVAQAPVFPRLQDPGASLLVLRVRDIDVAVAAAKGAGGTVVSTGGKPVATGPAQARAVAVRDPEGYYVEFQEVAAPSADAPAGNVVGGHFAAVVADAEAAAAFYHERFGLAVRNEAPSTDPALRAELGYPAGVVHRARVSAEGSPVEFTLVSVSGLGHEVVAPRIFDPGAPAFGFAVADFDAAFEAFRAAGSKVVTHEAPIRRPGGGGLSFVIDPFGLAIELQQPAPPAR